MLTEDAAFKLHIVY